MEFRTIKINWYMCTYCMAGQFSNFNLAEWSQITVGGNVGEEFLCNRDSGNNKDAHAVVAVVPRGILLAHASLLHSFFYLLVSKREDFVGYVRCSLAHLRGLLIL